MIGIDTKRVLKLINKIVSGDFTTSELNLFILYCQSFSKACLITEINHGRLDLNHSLIGQDQMDDFALDCIADLFARDTDAQLYLIKRFFEPQLEDLSKTPERVIPILRKLIASRVHQSLVALFSRIDQGGWKIWRNLSLASKRQPRIREFSHLGRVYMFYADEDENIQLPEGLNPQSKPIPDEVLLDWLQASLKNTYGLPQTVATILEDLRSQKTYQQFVSRGHVYYLLKELLNINSTEVEELDALVATDLSPVDSDIHNETFITVEDVHLYLHIELHCRYKDKGKINADVCESYHAILTLYFSDLINDGSVERLPKYLSLAGKTKLETGEWDIHRGRLEYMIKLGKSYIREILESHDIPSNSEMRVYT